jgi:alpha-D-ribose 1-methylphosphonate 5-triphosphate synthase subunit PhnH
MIPAEALRGGFADPVFDSQSVFRGILTALSRPGTVVVLGDTAAPPPPLASGAAAVVLTLADATSPVWLDPVLTGSIPAWIGFHTGAPVVALPAAAAFAVVVAGPAAAPYHAFPLGTAEYPDRSATIILQVESLEGGPPLVLTGPGIDGEARIAPRPLPADFVGLMRANRALFPRGVDLFLVAGNRVAGLPRSIRIAGDI